jgi:hypothetical protein
MAYDEWSDYFDLPYDFTNEEREDFVTDQYLESLVDAAFFEGRDFAEGEFNFLIETIEQYLLDEYDMTFDDVFDWDDWRESYNAS